MRTKLQVRPLICSAQAVRGPGQTGWWSHVFVLGRIEEAILPHSAQSTVHSFCLCPDVENCECLII